MQETKFPVEILVHDDASTDGTAEIVAAYQKKYPSLIRATLRTENQYSKGNSPGRYLRSIARGEYIAYCEGDDSWISPVKLQTQYEYLQAFPTAIMAAHDAEVIGESGPAKTASPSRKDELECIPGTQIIAGRHLKLLSVFHRNHKIALGQGKPRHLVNGDRYLFAMLSVYGDTILSSAPMARYRIHGGGVWSGATRENRYQNMVKSRIAIARDIAPSHCPFACKDLYKLTWIISGWYSRRGEFSKAMRFFWVIPLCLGLSLRTLRASPNYWPAMLAVQARIVIASVKAAGGITLRAMGILKSQTGAIREP